MIEDLREPVGAALRAGGAAEGRVVSVRHGWIRTLFSVGFIANLLGGDEGPCAHGPRTPLPALPYSLFIHESPDRNETLAGPRMNHRGRSPESRWGIIPTPNHLRESCAGSTVIARHTRFPDVSYRIPCRVLPAPEMR